MPFGVPSRSILYGYNGARDEKQNGVEENFQVVYLQNRKILEEQSCYLSSTSSL